MNKTISILDNLNIDTKTYNELKRFFNNWQNIDLGYESIEDKFNKCNYSKEITEKYKDFCLNYYKYRKINMQLIEIINKLKDNNYNIYIISDNNKEVLNYYKKHNLFKNIDGWVLSCEYNTIKKDGILFDIILNKYNLKAEECFFIDDRIINVKEAEKHGIKSYIFNEKEDINKLYNKMRSININI